MRRVHKKPDTVKALLEENVAGLTFYRMTTTDEVVCRELIIELGRRDVHLSLVDPPNGYRGGLDNIALIAEWDTPYGRALPLSFVHEMTGKYSTYPENGDAENVHAFEYLRGIDGMLPGTSNQEQGARSGDELDGNN